MGAAVRMEAAPRFRVRATGSLEQLPGCPEYSLSALAPERLDRLCAGECYHPSDVRRRITRIEVVRIRPQRDPDESVQQLVDDPWIRHLCPPDPAGCVLEFGDPEFTAGARETAYYVRAIEEPSPAINGDGMGCTYDEAGRCVKLDPCYQDYRTAPDDDCLSTIEERAWSSPIWVEYGTP
jgi:hypothetical protein